MPLVTVSTGSLFSYGLERSLRLIAQSGLTKVELMTRDLGKEGYADTWDVSYLQDIADAFGLAYQSVHTPFGIANEQHDMYFQRTCRLALDLGAEEIILHIPRRGEESYKVWFDDFVAHGLIGGLPHVCMENMGTKAYYNEKNALWAILISATT